MHARTHTHTHTHHSRELSKALRALHSLMSYPGENEEEQLKNTRETVSKLRTICYQPVKEGEVANPLKILQIHLKHILMDSDKIRGE